MATDVGSIYLEVFADTKALKAQVRKAAKDAGKGFGKEWGDEAEKSMSPALSNLGKQMLRKMENNGRQSGRAWGKAIQDEVRSIDLDLDFDIAKAFGGRGSWDEVFSQFGSLDEALDKLTVRIDEANGKSGELSKGLGLGAGGAQKLKDQMNAAADAIRQFGDTQDEVNRAHDEWNDSVKEGIANDKAWTQEQDRLTKAFEQNLRVTQSIADERRKGTEEKARKDTEALNKAIKEQNDLLAKRSFRQSAQDQESFRQETERLQSALKKASADLDTFGKSPAAKIQTQRIKELSAGYDGLNGKISDLLNEHKRTTAGMDKNSNEFILSLAKTRAEVAALEAELKGLGKVSTKLKIDVDTPKRAVLRAEGAAGGRAYGAGFKAGLGKLGSLGAPFTALGSQIGAAASFAQGKWKEFAIAMPAGLQFILANIALLAGPLATVGSAIGSLLLPLVGALTTAAVGLAAAIGGIGAAAGYAVLLAVKSFKEFKDNFPEVQAGIDDLKNSFENIDVPRFAKEWSASLTEFTHTLADSLEFDTVAENLGKATAKITEAFTGILKSPAWTGFVDAIEGPLSSALAGIGVGLAGVFGVALQWMTAAAPLAQALGEQFAAWGTALNDALASPEGQQQLTAFMDLASNGIMAIIPLITNLSEAFKNIFLAGTETGNTFLTTLAGLAENFAVWTSSVQGQEALNQLFDQGLAVFQALLPLIGALGEAFNVMVTPESVASLIVFMNALTGILPILGNLVAAMQGLGAFDLIAQALGLLGQLIQPLLPTLTTLADTIGNVLSDALVVLGPVIDTVAQALIPLGAAFGQLLEALGPAIQQVIGALGPLFAALGPVITSLVQAITPLIPIFAQLITMIAGALAQVLPALMPVFAALSPVIGAVVQAIMPLIPIFANLITIVANLVAQILPPLMPVLAAIGELFTALAPVIAEIGGKIADLLVKAVVALAPLLSSLVPVIMSLVEAFLPIIDVVFELAGTLIDALMPIFMALLPIITTLAPTIIQLVVAFTPVLRIVQLLAPILNLLLPPLSSLIVMFLNLITPLLDLIEPILTFAVQLFAGKKAIDDILGGLEQFALKVIEVAGTVGKWFTKLGDDVANVFGKFGEWFSKIGSQIQKFIGEFVQFGENLIMGFLNGLTGAWATVVAWFTGILSEVIRLVKSVFGIASPSTVFAEIGDFLIQGFLNGITAAWEAVVSFFTGIGATVAGWFSGALDWLYDLGSDIITGLLDGITTIWNNLVAFGDSIEDAIKGWFSGALDWLVQLGTDVFTGLWNGITTIWNTLVTFGDSVEDKIKGWFSGALTWLKSLGSDVFTGLFNGIKTAWDTAVAWSDSIEDKIKGWFSGALTWLKEAGSNLMSGLLNGITTGWNAVTSWVSGIGGKILSSIGSLTDTLYSAGKNLIQGLLDGMKKVFEDAKKFVSGIGSWIADHKGPKSYDLNLLVPAGGWIMDGLSQGIRDSIPDLKRTLGDVTAAINVGGAASVGVNPVRGGGNATGPLGQVGGGTTVASGAIQIITPVRDPTIVAHMVLDGLVARAQ